MKNISRILLLTALFLQNVVEAQLPDRGDGRLLYRKEAVGGLIIHTAGWGANFRYGTQITYKQKLSFGLDIVNLRHPKEKKVFNDSYDDGKGFYYGKINSLLAVRPSIGYRNILFPSLRTKGIELGYNVAVGPSLGFLKPVYLEIVYLNNDGSTVVSEEVYNPAIHTVDNIYGRARTTKGLNEMKLYPGIFAKAGLHFEYGEEDEAIKALEVGACADYYFRDVPIMVIAENKSLFLTFYVNLTFGRRYF